VTTETKGAVQKSRAIVAGAEHRPARYVQAAGFLKIPTVIIHWIKRGFIRKLSCDTKIADRDRVSPEMLGDKQKIEELRENSNLFHLRRSANDWKSVSPRSKTFSKRSCVRAAIPATTCSPIFKKGILKLEDLQPGMELKERFQRR